MADLLTGGAKEAALAPLLAAGWALDDEGKALSRSFKFADFKAAFAWMTQMALTAEAMDHHPEWFNVYRTVDVRLTTHDAGGVTTLDVTLAQAMLDAA